MTANAFWDRRSLQSSANSASWPQRSARGACPIGQKMEGELKLGKYLFVATLLVGALNGPSPAQEVKLGDLVISQPWSRSAPRGAEVATAYLTIENKGTAADRLLGGSAEIAEKIQIEQIGMAGGAMTLQTVEGGLAIAPGEKVVLAPGGYRLAPMKLKRRMKKGTRVSMMLQFEK